MSVDVAPVPAAGGALPARVRPISTDRPWRWLTLGWRDLLANKPVALAYGGALALFGWILTWILFETGAPWAVLPATAGFFILAPLLGAGLYETARRRQEGLETTLQEALAGFRRNGAQIAMMGALLLLIHLFWVRIAGLIFALFFGIDFAPELHELPFRMAQSPQFLPFLIIGTGVGFVLAAATFAVTALSIPMLVHKPDITFLEAVTVSIQGVLTNWKAMALWAGLITLFTGLALVPFFLGLVVAMPLVGFASWHAYRDVVVR